jgi:peptidoglycan L-alanyl-D-glutamate endopeptidase CwlK
MFVCRAHDITPKIGFRIPIRNNLGNAMLIFIALVYFCLACSGIWLAVFPSGREFVGGLVGSRARWTGSRHFKLTRRHVLLAAGGAALLIVPSLLALLFSNPGMLPGYDATVAAPDAQVAALLQGEQLAPPLALPPLAFTTLEVEQVRPMLVDASRNWALLHADFSQRLLLAFKIMKEKHGYEMALLEGYRSPARQDLLARMGSNVTNAGAFQSWHQYGLAADCAFWRDGKLVISEKDPWAMRGYQLYGEIAESLGLTWGGRWTMMDFGHAELRLRGVMRK